MPVNEFILSNEPAIRLAAFAGIFLVMALWEFAAPRRKRSHSRLVRWPSNVAISFLNTALLRFLIPTAAVGLAAVGEAQGWGLFNQIDVPFWVAFIGAVLILDFIIYLQHVMFHAVPLLWRLHRMHHADLDIDVTTGARFHPVEIILSMIIKLGAVAALGPPAVAVVVFEVVLNATSMFNHSNVRLPLGLDRVLRLVVVTPDMHRVHHSVIPNETNSNFGFNVPWWDRLFGTYKAQPEKGHDGMTIGIEQFREGRELWLDRMLTQPARGPASGYPLNKRGHNE
jgi:sterol desaturase/sphingolipid hydroxylase (fatty acid hydroxylase superfamily)